MFFNHQKVLKVATASFYSKEGGLYWLKDLLANMKKLLKPDEWLKNKYDNEWMNEWISELMTQLIPDPVFYTV